MFNDNNHSNVAFDKKIDEIGDLHLSTSIDTPMRPDAFEKSDEEKIQIISEHFEKIMETLG